MPENITELSAIAIICLFLIKEIFSYLKAKKNGNGFNKQILLELQSMNENHLNTICRTIGTGNKEIVKAIIDLGDKIDNMEKSLGGKLDRLIGRSDK